MYETYCRLRDSKGLKDSNVADLAGIPRSTFTDWKSGKSKPKTEKMGKIAAVLGVPTEYLLTGDGKYLVQAFVKEVEPTLTKQETDLINAFRNADDLTQQMVLRVLGLEKDGNSSVLKEA